MSVTKINPAYIRNTITAVKGSNLSKSKQDTVIAALDKQIPKKMDYEGDGCDAVSGNIIFDTAICPTCKKIFEVDYDDNVNYCLECGQRLKWEVSDE